ncbi:MAG TPA: histidine phosphatase family protein [Ilumatobacteraceae bacterium]
MLLIRHALPVRRELVEGAADPDLSEDGITQSQHLADYLATEAVHAIYASPLRRAVQTAAPLAARLQLPVIVLDGVAEYDRHANEYVPIEELKASNDPRWQQMLANDWSDRPETQVEFTGRVVGAIDGVAAAHPGHNVAVVCHGGVINAYLAHVLGTAQSSGFFYPNYTSIHRVLAARSGARQIITINETPHLRGTGLPIGLYGK